MNLADGTGLPILSVRELVVRPVSAAQLTAAAAAPRAGGGLLEVTWSPVWVRVRHCADDGVTVWEPSSELVSAVGWVYTAAHEALECVAVVAGW